MSHVRLFIFTALIISTPLFAAGKQDTALAATYDAGSEEIIKVAAFSSIVTEQTRAEQVMRALAMAYPRRITEVEFKDGDWAVRLRGQWYYYAEGKLLPEAWRSRSAEFSPQPFYPYPALLPEWKRPTKSEAARLAEAAKRRQNGGAADRALFFYDAVWNIKNREEAWNQVKTIRFLGKSILVHHGIMEELALVEQKINEAARSDPAVRKWLSELSSIAAWNWRNIADIKTRSNHAYGVAVDILPNQKLYRSLEKYWLWAAKTNKEWWNVPYSRRYHPPQAVIKAFEAYGFVWGGKWAFYDTMHFEYRPEILFLNGIEVNGEY
jgi:hypothetical protein